MKEERDDFRIQLEYERSKLGDLDSYMKKLKESNRRKRDLIAEKNDQIKQL